MAIEVKHGANPGAALTGAFGAGQGAARQLLKKQQLQAMEAQNAADQQRQFQQQQSAANRQFQFDMGDVQHQQQIERMDANALSQNWLAGQAQQRRQDDFDFEYTAKQRMELDQLANSEADMMASEDYSPQEKTELRRRFAAKRAGIQPVERPRKPTPTELFKANTYIDPKTGAFFPLDEQGTPGRPIYQPPEREPSWQDRIKAFQAATVVATNSETGGIDDAKFKQAMESMGFGDSTQARNSSASEQNTSQETGQSGGTYSAENMQSLMDKAGVAKMKTGAKAKETIMEHLQALEKTTDPVERLKHFKVLRSWRETLEQMVKDNR